LPTKVSLTIQLEEPVEIGTVPRETDRVPRMDQRKMECPVP
jgi:hypothetical protein